MIRSSGELLKLQTPIKDKKTDEIADIYKSSTLLLNVCSIDNQIYSIKERSDLFQDLFSTIANYKITGENVAVKQELMRSKMKLVDQTAADVRLFLGCSLPSLFDSLFLVE